MLLFDFISVFPISSQTFIGEAKVSVFSKSEYGAGTQNWDIERDGFGRIYIANNEGLLVNNGIQWKLYPVPNKTILRSIAFGADGKLYAGAQDDFGYYEPDNIGRLVYTSLKNQLPTSVYSFADVWNIEVLDNEVYFMASEIIFRYANKKLTYYKPNGTWLALEKHHNELLAQDAKKGIMVFQKGQWISKIDVNALPTGFQITDIKPFGKDTSLVSTAGHGLYKLVKNVIYPFTLFGLKGEKHFTTLEVTDKSDFLAGSYNTGLYRIDHTGNVLGIISSKQGLISNTIRCIYTGFDGYTWIGLDNSIAQIDWNNPISHINPPSFNNGSGQGAILLNGEIYFALSTGLQWLPLGQFKDLSNLSIEPTMILDGLTWNLSLWGDQVVAGRDDGLWKIKDHQASNISKSSGYWTFLPIPGSASTKIACGNYLGIRLFSQENGVLKDEGIVENFVESSRYMAVDGEFIWVSHPYHGLFKIDLTDNSVHKYTAKNGLPADLDNHVFRLKGKIVIATTKGIYELEQKSDKLVPSPYFQNLFGKRPIRYLKEDLNGNIWFVQDKMLGVADFEEGKPVIHFIPELSKHILSGFENILSYDADNVLVGSDIGFYNINYKKYKKRTFPYQTYLSSVKVFGNGDSIIYGGFQSNGINDSIQVSIPFNSNSIRFTFASSFIRNKPLIEFSYYLEGFEKTWSNWGTLQEKEYTNLREGEYTFHLKCRYGPSNEFKEATFSFRIEPPWYRTIWAYLCYFLGFLLIVWLVLKLQKYKLLKKEERRALEAKAKYEEEQRQIHYKHQIKLEKKEKAIIQLKNENLQAEIRHKNEELASSAMNLLQKKAFLGKISTELSKVYLPIKDQVDTTEIRQIIRHLSSEEKLDEEWKQFSIHFNSVHNDFLITLKKAYPDLNAHDMKLCAYLRMNLSSKEIAQLFSISVRGVEISRYRLRKKLKLKSEQDLFEFLINIQVEDGGK